MAAAETAKLVAELSLKDKLSGGVKSATTSIDKLDKKVGNLGRSINKGVSTAGRNIGRGIELGAFAAAGAIVYATKSAADFESQMNIINTVAKQTGDAFTGSLGGIGDQIRKLARDTGTSTSDLTQAYYDLVSAGISAADAQNVLVAANTLAIGGLSTTAEAVDLLTTAINSYGGNAKNATVYANQFAEAIAAGKVTAAEIAASFATVGPIAAKFGVGINQISAALGVMTAQGTPASEAFTQMRAAIVALEKPNSAMLALQKQTGIDFAKFAKKNGLAAAYDLLAKKAKAAGIPMAKLTGRIEGAQFAAQVTGKNLDKYNKELDKVNKSSEGAGEAARQMAERTKGFNFALGRLQANVKDAAITIGSELLPPLADLASEMTDFLTAHQPEIKQFAQDLAGGIKGAISWLRGLNWGVIAESFRTAAGFAKGLLDAFLGMPSWVQAAVVSGWGLNKLTGGAFGDILGGLSKGLGQWVAQKLGLMTVSAGVVHVNGPVVGGGGGIPGVPAAGAGAGEAAGATGLKTLGAIVGGAILPVSVVAIGSAAAIALIDAQAKADVAAGRVNPAAANLDFGRSAKFAAPSSKPATDKGLQEVKDAVNENPKVVAARIEAAKVAQVQQIRDTGSTTGFAIHGTTGAVVSAQSAITAAIAANRPVMSTSVVVNVTAASVTKSVTTSSRVGPTGGSYANGGHGTGDHWP